MGDMGFVGMAISFGLAGLGIVLWLWFIIDSFRDR